MSASPLPPTTALRSLYLKWKSLKLPWRKRWLAGTDLQGNTFWYFQPDPSARPRRIASQRNPATHYSDLHLSPQWHQWLRYTRPTPPSIPEQQADIVRQTQLKYLAQQADERWAAKGSFLEEPKEERSGDEGGRLLGDVGAKAETEKERGRGREKENPWNVQRGRAGERWQPKSWSPSDGGRKE